MAPYSRSHKFLFVFHRNYIVSFTVFVISVENASFSYPLSLNLHDHLEPLGIFLKILTQTAKVPELLDGAKILAKSSTLCARRTNVTDDRQTDEERQTDSSYHKAKVTFASTGTYERKKF